MQKICLLQETGRYGEARRLEPVLLDPLVKAYRDIHGVGALPEDRLRALLVCEQERVRDAAALGELLIPMLVECLRARPEATSSAGLSAVPFRPPPHAAPLPLAAPDIADLLDGMLAQESARPAVRARPRGSDLRTTTVLKP